ncbi:LysR substrate-binding domain-containing protein [Ruegeria faecimaris]|uniref:LysR substrate-binding domain-containing protein n=1 Tax=Ruegeria faecimaris TaxID=686389 RepID=UPI002491016A|nr:LysR substrate-binding domain-containing protein [Ruegeria faecimaris]
MAKLPHVTWLRAFEVAARHNSFSAAAEELGLTSAAVSQQIRLLEKHLNVSLFERLPRGVALTEIGRAYAMPVQKTFSELRDATSGLFTNSRRRVVKIRASISCAGLVIAPRLVEFENLHPDIKVDLSTFVWANRFGEEESDIDIRFGYGDWDDGIVSHLGHECAVPVCHPDYAASFGADLSIQNLAQGRVVAIKGSENDWMRLSDQYTLNLGAPSRTLRMDSSFLALQAVTAGQGAAMVLENFAHEYIKQGLLVAPFDYRLPIQPSHYLVKRKGAEDRIEVQVFASWVTSLY